MPWSHGHSKRCDPQAPVDVQTPLPDLLSALRLARTAGSSAGIQERRDPRLAPRGRGLAPTTQPTTLLLARPGRPRGVDPPPLPKAASAPSIRDARDIAALASGPDQRRWRYPHRQPGRPSTVPELRRLILRMAAENPPGATDASTVNLPSLDKRSHRARCGCSSDDAVSTRHPGASLTWQQFLAAQAEGPWPATSSMLRPSCSSACTAVRAGGLHSPGPYPWRDGQPNRGRVAQQARNGSVALVAGRQGGETPGMRTAHRSRRSILACSAFAGFRFPSDVIVLAVRWYLRLACTTRDVEELLTERGVEVDHVTVYRWVLRFTPLLAEAARPCRHVVGDRWQVDETYVKVAGRWRYVYRAVDQFGQVIDVLIAERRDARAAGSSTRPLTRPESRPSRSPPIRRRSTRPYWRTCCQQPGTAPTSTPTTGSSAITAG